jgi:hypothetical protein
MTPHGVDIKQDKVGNGYTKFDKLTGQDLGHTGGSSSVDPESATKWQDMVGKTTFSGDPSKDGQLLDTLNRVGMSTGAIQAPQSSLFYNSLGAQGKAATQKDIAATNRDNSESKFTDGAKTANTNSETQFRSGPQTALIAAQIGKEQVNTAGAQGDFTTKHSDAIAQSKAEVAELGSLQSQAQQAQVIAHEIAGKYGSGKGAVAAFMGNNNEDATKKQLLQQFQSNLRLQGIAQDEAGTGAKGPNASLYKGYGEHGVAPDSTPDAVATMAALMDRTLDKRIAAENGKITGHQQALDWLVPNGGNANQPTQAGPYGNR